MITECPHCSGKLAVYPEDVTTIHDRLIHACADHFGITADELAYGPKQKKIAAARQVAMWAMRQAGFSFPYIAERFLKDHSTVQYACRKVAESPDLTSAGLEIIELVGAPDLKPARMTRRSEFMRSLPKAEGPAHKNAYSRRPLKGRAKQKLDVSGLAKSTNPWKRTSRPDPRAARNLEEFADAWEAAE